MIENVTITFNSKNTLKSKIINFLTDSLYTQALIEYESGEYPGTVELHPGRTGLSPRWKEFSMNTQDPQYRIAGNKTFRVPDTYAKKSYKKFSTLFFVKAVVKALFWKAGFGNIDLVKDLCRYTYCSFIIEFLKVSGVACDLDPETTWSGMLEKYFRKQPDAFRRINEQA
jgi:hypothetical protein